MSAWEEKEEGLEKIGGRDDLEGREGMKRDGWEDREIADLSIEVKS